MVYRGKPSKGCATCRARKIKCDQAVPACGQCTRADKTCPGYRNLADLMFQDESSDVIRKAQEKQNALRKSQSPTPESSTSNQMILAVPEPAPAPALSQAMEDLAVAFFFENFVQPGTASQKGVNEYMPAVFHSGAARGTYATAVAAVGLAGLSNTTQCTSLMQNARETYNKALAMTKKGLLDPVLAKDDSILASTILLSLFETVTCSRPEQLEQWGDHISGAAALITLRGPDQFRTSIGRQIFWIARGQMVISSIQRDAHVPQPILELSNFIHNIDMTDDQPPNVMTQVSIRLSNLRAFVYKEKPTDYHAVILSFYKIERELSAWLGRLPDSWAYQVLSAENTGVNVYGDSYFVYPSFWHANIWNNWRCIRLLANDSLHEQLCKGLNHPELTPDRQVLYIQMKMECEDRLRQLSADIAASVPYHFGLHTLQNGANDLRQPALGGYFMLWPLFLTANTPTADNAFKDWLIEQLEYVASAMGIHLAHALATIIESRRVNVVSQSSDVSMEVTTEPSSAAVSA